MRRKICNPDGKGAKLYPVHDMAPVLAEDSKPGHRRYDYRSAVTDVDCPCCDGGTIRDAEARRRPGYRTCNWCGRHFMAGGSARRPTLIELEDYTVIIQSPI